MEAILVTNKTGQIEASTTTFEIFDKDFENSHAIDLRTGFIFQVVGKEDDGGLLFYVNKKNGIGFNYAEDGNMFRTGTGSKYVDFWFDPDEKWSGSAVDNLEIVGNFDNLDKFSEVKSWAEDQGVKFEILEFWNFIKPTLKGE